MMRCLKLLAPLSSWETKKESGWSFSITYGACWTCAAGTASAHFGGDRPLTNLRMPIDDPSRHRVEKREAMRSLGRPMKAVENSSASSLRESIDMFKPSLFGILTVATTAMLCSAPLQSSLFVFHGLTPLATFAATADPVQSEF